MVKGIVYVVDDEKDVVSSCCDALRDSGYFPIPGYTLSDALRYLESDIPVCVVSDDHIGSQHGLEILEYIAETPRLRRVGFVMISGDNEDRNTIERVLNLNGEFLPKPFDMDALIGAVELQIRLHNSPRNQLSSRLLQ